jgi:2-alkenal reductase
VTARRPLAAATAALALAGSVAGCDPGGDGDGDGTATAPPQGQTSPAPPGRVEVIRGLPEGDFDPSAIYRRLAPGVVTVISVLDGEAAAGGRGLGSGFVISGSGEVLTNAHVVTEGEGGRLRRASSVYVQFGDGNQVPARIVGTDPNSDVALLQVSPRGLTLRPLPLGSSAGLRVGVPVAAIGSPFGEPQSLSVGVVSATNRTIESLTGFQISDAIQTDAAVNRGNSGGPLVDARGRVLGINSQIQTAGGGSEGVGFAVPVDTVKRALAQLRARGRVSYAYIGVATVPLFPQLARRLGVPVDRGALVQEVTGDSPAARAGIRGGSGTLRFQAERYRLGGDVITALDGQPIREQNDLGRAIEARRPGQQVTVEVYRGSRKLQVRLRLGERPASAAQDAEQP